MEKMQENKEREEEHEQHKDLYNLLLWRLQILALQWVHISHLFD